MARLPPKTRDQLNPEQQELEEELRQVANKGYGRNGDLFIYEDPRGAFIGPFPFFLHQPSAGKALVDLSSAIAKLPLPPDARETAILTVGGHFQAGFETYSHFRTATKQGLKQEQADVLKKDGGKPEGLNGQCSIAYDVAKHLVSKTGPLPQNLWERSVEAFGKDGTVGLLHYIGYYCYMCVILNGMDAPVPE